MNVPSIRIFHNSAELKTFIARSWSVSWPITLIMFFEFLINLTDVFIAGKIGKEVQAAYGFVTQIYFIFTVIGNALTVGTVSVISRLCTTTEEKLFADSIVSSVAASLFAGILLGATGIVFTPVLFQMLNVPNAIKEYGQPLAVIYASALIFHYLLISTNGILRSCKGIKKSLRTMAIVCLLNVGLNFLLVFHTSLGYKGIALSTAISVLIGSLLNLWIVRSFFNSLRQVTWSIVKKITSIGWPSGLLQIIWQLASMVLFIILSALPENNIEIIAAFTNGLRIEAAIFLPAFAFNMANAVIVGNVLGERRKEDAFRAGLTTASLGVLLIIFLSVVVLFNAKGIVTLLSNNEIVVRESVRYLYICLICEPIMAWGVILGGALNGAGDTRSMMKIVALSVWLVRIPFAYVLGVVADWGVTAIWWSMNASLIAQAFFITRRFYLRKWLPGDSEN
ncbi:MAG: MATE family efflux transporter [Candidatus Zhuqueibacterota bacterium]